MARVLQKALVLLFFIVVSTACTGDRWEMVDIRDTSGGATEAAVVVVDRHQQTPLAAELDCGFSPLSIATRTQTTTWHHHRHIRQYIQRWSSTETPSYRHSASRTPLYALLYASHAYILRVGILLI
ncbi:MAG: hypothetical protein II951_09715 [Bacteroidales bacterium]|nr:hypothetical protein [Bacteroidales bacterium]